MRWFRWLCQLGWHGKKIRMIHKMTALGNGGFEIVEASYVCQRCGKATGTWRA